MSGRTVTLLALLSVGAIATIAGFVGGWIGRALYREVLDES